MVWTIILVSYSFQVFGNKIRIGLWQTKPKWHHRWSESSTSESLFNCFVCWWCGIILEHVNCIAGLALLYWADIQYLHMWMFKGVHVSMCLLGVVAYACNVHVSMCTYCICVVIHSHARKWMCKWTVCLWMPDPRVPTGRPATTLTSSRRTSRRRSRWQRGGGPASVSWATNSPPSFCPSRR